MPSGSPDELAEGKKVLEEDDPAVVKGSVYELDAAFGSLEEPLTEWESEDEDERRDYRGAEGKTDKEEDEPVVMKATFFDLDAAFGNLEEPLTEWDSEDEDEQNDSGGTDSKKRKRRGR
jgi:hypothetical protein